MSVKCDICGKEFKNNAGLAGHVAIIHATDTNKGKRPSDRKISGDCAHVWKRLTGEQLRMVDADGVSLAAHGCKYYCAECGEVK